MDFDKTKVYSKRDADEVKVGSKGYFADTYNYLMLAVMHEEDDEEDVDYFFGELTEIESGCLFTFKAENHINYAYFYLMEKPEELKYRPYTSGIEMYKSLTGVDHVDGHGYALHVLCTPVIDKEDSKIEMITGLNEMTCSVCLSDSGWCSFKTLFETHTYLDGTPCGVKEERK